MSLCKWHRTFYECQMLLCSKLMLFLNMNWCTNLLRMRANESSANAMHFSSLCFPQSMPMPTSKCNKIGRHDWYGSIDCVIRTIHFSLGYDWKKWCVYVYSMCVASFSIFSIATGTMKPAIFWIVYHYICIALLDQLSYIFMFVQNLLSGNIYLTFVFFVSVCLCYLYIFWIDWLDTMKQSIELIHFYLFKRLPDFNMQEKK